MTNERLRDAMQSKGFDPQAVADKLRVDRKTVERWITKGRAPYPRYRRELAALLKESENYLWPAVLPAEKQQVVSESELVKTYPRRYSVPNDLWKRLFNQATDFIGILAYAGLFLPEQNADLVETLKAKASTGTKIVVLLGDPKSDAVAIRGEEEGIGQAMAEKVRNVLSFYGRLEGVEGVFVGYHTTTLYNSIYRFDNEMLVNTHILGCPAAHAPVMHLRELAGGSMFQTFSDSFDRVWSGSRDIWTGQVVSGRINTERSDDGTD
jgi:transcriptional regulator with XRE-family HTH domain